jgi:prevent-host-death family protein
MLRVTISALKNNLSRYLRSVRKGESIEILDRDTPVARIVPPPRNSTEDVSGWFEDQVRAGVIKRGSGRFSSRVLKSVPPGKPGVLRALLEERRGGR